MPFEQKKARAIALMDSKKMWRSNYAPPLLRILWRLGIRLPPLPFMPFWQVAVLTGGLWGTSWGCAMWFIGVVCGRGRNPTLRLWPAIFSGEIDVFPSERRNMGQEIGR